MTLTQFGPFAAVFEKGELAVPGYLELLHLHQPGAQIVIDRVERALSATGPDGTRDRDAKMLASLLTASAAIPSLERWATDLQRSVRVEQLFKEHVWMQDEWISSCEIVVSWMSNVRRVFLERGRTLAPRAT